MPSLPLRRKSPALIAVIIVLTLNVATDAATRKAGSTNRKESQARQSSRNKRGCNTCPASTMRRSKRPPAQKRAIAPARSSCMPKGYVDPAISKNLSAAVKSMKRAGIKPFITSAWRSSDEQAKLHNCSRSSRCRRAHPGLYYALPPGRSHHEAAFAVDISGIAAGPRGAKRLTPQGRRIVSIMRQNGFVWRYGLADPAHFETDPKKHGYRSLNHAIRRNQRSCRISPASQKRTVARGGRKSGSATAKRERAQSNPVKPRRDSRG